VSGESKRSAESTIPVEAQVALLARQMRYPATPDVAAHWRKSDRRPGDRFPLRLAWGAAVVAVALLIVLVATPLRAGIVEWLRFGAVQIRLGAESDLLELPSSEGASELAELLPRLQFPIPLDVAAAEVDFPLLTPTLLPAPDAVYHTGRAENEVVTLVWHRSDGAPTVLLQAFGPATIFQKMQPQSIEAVQVNGEYAIWTTGPYPATLANGETTMRQLVRNHALIWTQEGITWRLESALPRVDAIRIAESLAPMSR